jgi:hypothetical protein
MTVPSSPPASPTWDSGSLVDADLGIDGAMGIDQLREDNELAAVRRELDRLVANRAMTGLSVGQREEYLALCARERRLLEGRLGGKTRVFVGANA